MSRVPLALQRGQVCSRATRSIRVGKARSAAKRREVVAVIPTASRAQPTRARRATSTLVTLESDRAMDAYNHDVVEEVIPLDGRDLRLLRPRDAEALLDEHAFEHEEFLPYWAELWPSSLALANALSRRALRGARTLELGCGLGLPSIAAAIAGGRVLATDWSSAAVEMTNARIAFAFA